MILLIQRVTSASVRVNGETIAAIDAGLLALAGFTPDDDAPRVTALLQRCVQYRIFADEAGRMNRALREHGGGLLLVPQFTLAADTHSGMRPSFSKAAKPDQASALFAHSVRVAHQLLPGQPVESGRFGADMAVHLVNDGPVTFWLDSDRSGAATRPR